MLIGILTTLLILTVLILIILITVFQHGNEGGIGSSLGGGNSSGFFGASGGANIIVKATWVTGGLFFLLSLTLAWVKTNQSFAVSSEIDNLLSEPAASPTPAIEGTPEGQLAPTETNEMAPSANPIESNQTETNQQPSSEAAEQAPQSQDQGTAPDTAAPPAAGNTQDAPADSP